MIHQRKLITRTGVRMAKLFYVGCYHRRIRGMTRTFLMLRRTRLISQTRITTPLILFAYVLEKSPLRARTLSARGTVSIIREKKPAMYTHDSLVLPDRRASLSITLGALAIGRITTGALYRTEASILYTLAETIVTWFHRSGRDGGCPLRHLWRNLLGGASRSPGTELTGVVPILWYRRLQIMWCRWRCTRCSQ
jgi:hypothetical protein